jgi:ribosomal-protein-alanine N-acetyltransferase
VLFLSRGKSVTSYSLVWNDCVPTITTERLILRLYTEDDADNVLDYFRKQQDHFKAWFPDYSVEMTREMVVSASTRKHEMAREDRSYEFQLFLRAEPMRVVGQCSVADVKRGTLQQAFIGYALAAEFQGQGFMTEAVRASIEFAFSDLDLHRLEGTYVADNVKSAAVLASCGFEQEGVFKDYQLLNGRWQDRVVTSLLNPDWRGVGRVIMQG